MSVKKLKKRSDRSEKRVIKSKKKVRLQRSRKTKKDRVHYYLNPEFGFFDELRNLILKSSPAEKDKMIKRFSGLGRVKLVLITGVFMNENLRLKNFDSGTDLFVVGDDIDKSKLRSLLKSLEAEVGKEIRFSLMEKEEFEYRYNMFDRFVRVLVEGPHEKLINKLGL